MGMKRIFVLILPIPLEAGIGEGKPATYFAGPIIYAASAVFALLKKKSQAAEVAHRNDFPKRENARQEQLLRR